MLWSFLARKVFLLALPAVILPIFSILGGKFGSATFLMRIAFSHAILVLLMSFIPIKNRAWTLRCAAAAAAAAVAFAAPRGAVYAFAVIVPHAAPVALIVVAMWLALRLKSISNALVYRFNSSYVEIGDDPPTAATALLLSLSACGYSLASYTLYSLISSESTTAVEAATAAAVGVLIAVAAALGVASERAPITDMAFIGPAALFYVYRGARESMFTPRAAASVAQSALFDDIATLDTSSQASWPAVGAIFGFGSSDGGGKSLATAVGTGAALIAAQQLLRLLDLSLAIASISWLLRTTLSAQQIASNNDGDGDGDSYGGDIAEEESAFKGAARHALRVGRDLWLSLLYSRETFVFLGLVAPLGFRWRWIQASVMLVTWLLRVLYA